jgi:hypothetical protein
MKELIPWMVFAALLVAAVVSIQFLFVQPIRELSDSRIWRTGICAEAQPCPAN